MAAEVFISYASKNRDRILDLVERLRGAGVSVWIDQMGIEGAAMWSQQIDAAIRDCKVLILAISKNSASSENVVKELALASEGRKRILPVFIEEADIPETMAYQLAGIQRVEFFEGNEEAGLKAVIRALATLDVDVCSDATAAAGAEAGQAVRRHRIEVRRSNVATPVEPDISPAEVVAHDEDEIGCLLCGTSFGGRPGRDGDQEKERGGPWKGRGIEREGRHEPEEGIEESILSLSPNPPAFPAKQRLAVEMQSPVI